MDQPKAVAALIRLNGGRIVGKTRLQKTVYLLQSCGIDLGFDFNYHHYGPYSEELSIASNDAVALRLVEMAWHNANGNEYAVFTSIKDDSEVHLPKETKRALDILKEYDATILELAATADFLSKNGFRGQAAWEETFRRKASKISDVRVEKSKQLLDSLRRAA